MIPRLWFRLMLLSLPTLFFCSCSTETNFYSDNTFSNDFLVVTKKNISLERITYTSQLSNLISTFPKFKNKAVNTEVIELKQNLMNYLYATNNSNDSDKKKYLKHFENNYKNVQKLRKTLGNDEDQILNRYLVKIKTNINLLEAAEKNEIQADAISN